MSTEPWNDAWRTALDSIARSLITGEPVTHFYDSELSEALRCQDHTSWTPTAAHTVTYSGRREGLPWTVQLLPARATT